MGGRRGSVLRNKNSTTCKLHYEILSVCTGGQEGKEKGRKGWRDGGGRRECLCILKEKLCSLQGAL